MRAQSLTPMRFLSGLIAALAVRGITRLTPNGPDRPGFAGVHRYLTGAVANDADVGDGDFTAAELGAMAAALTPGQPLIETLDALPPSVAGRNPVAAYRDAYRIALDPAAATAVLAGYDTQEMGFIAVAAHVFLRETVLPA